MKARMSFYSRMMLLMVLMTSGPGCAQPYPPRRYDGTTYDPLYTTHTYSPPSGRYQPTYPPTIRQTRAAEARAAEASRRANRRIAEIEARAKRRTDEIEARVRRQTEEIQRRVARQTEAASRQSAWSPPPAPTWEIHSWPDEEISVATEDVWEVRLPAEVNCFSNLQTDEGFVPQVFATDTHALFIWPLAAGEDARNAAMNLVAVKNELLLSEPDAVVEMVLLSDDGQARGVSQWQSQGVRCMDASQFSAFAERFFAASNEQNRSRDGTSHFVGAGGTGKDSPWGTMLAKAKEGAVSATNYLKTAPWWVWAIGAGLIFVAVFSACLRDANTHPFQTQDGNPWVRDPSGR